MWLRTAKLGDLPADITPYVLRHSFASLAADLGYNELTIATLLGHKTLSSTSRHVHSVDAVASATMKLIGRKGHRSGFGPSATTVAGSASRWISHVGRIHLTL
jgi:integrase